MKRIICLIVFLFIGLNCWADYEYKKLDILPAQLRNELQAVIPEVEGITVLKSQKKMIVHCPELSASQKMEIDNIVENHIAKSLAEYIREKEQAEKQLLKQTILDADSLSELKQIIIDLFKLNE